MTSRGIIVLFPMILLDRERNNSRESDGDRYIKVINDIVSLIAHLYQMKNRLFIQDSAFFKSF